MQISRAKIVETIVIQNLSAEIIIKKKLYLNKFSSGLQKWFEKEERSLPWRRSKNPYFIWLSEVILQQTRIEQGLAYYDKFINSYPTVHDLANASEQEVLKNWQGLGYYSRARNLHKAAKVISENYKGEFPKEYKEIIKLPGIGPYTAAAISSIAFKEKRAVVDGNVYRLLSRLFGISTPIDSTEGKKEFQLLAERLLLPNEPGRHNEAMMDFGSMICKPKSPNCESCFAQKACIAFKGGLQGELPVKSKKIKKRKRYFASIIIRSSRGIYFQKQVSKGIWHNLYLLPQIEVKSEQQLELGYLKVALTNFLQQSSIQTVELGNQLYKHQLTHLSLHSKILACSMNKPLTKIDSLELISFDDIHKLPIPRLVERMLEDTNVL